MRVITTGPSVYQSIADALIEKINDIQAGDLRGVSVFSGTVGLLIATQNDERCDDTYFHMQGIVYWSLDRTEVTDIVPTWWEFVTRNTYQIFENDFDYNEFKPYLIDAFNRRLRGGKIVAYTVNP